MTTWWLSVTDEFLWGFFVELITNRTSQKTGHFVG